MAKVQIYRKQIMLLDAAERPQVDTFIFYALHSAALFNVRIQDRLQRLVQPLHEQIARCPAHDVEECQSGLVPAAHSREVQADVSALQEFERSF
jgi:hypothetical protein